MISDCLMGKLLKGQQEMLLVDVQNSSGANICSLAWLSLPAVLVFNSLSMRFLIQNSSIPFLSDQTFNELSQPTPFKSSRA